MSMKCINKKFYSAVAIALFCSAGVFAQEDKSQAVEAGDCELHGRQMEDKLRESHAGTSVVVDAEEVRNRFFHDVQVAEQIERRVADVQVTTDEVRKFFYSTENKK